MNSTNWPAPSVWVFIGQMVEHCSTNAEAMGLNPVEAPNFFFFFWGGGGGRGRIICNCLNCNYHCDDHIFI